MAGINIWQIIAVEVGFFVGTIAVMTLVAVLINHRITDMKEDIKEVKADVKSILNYLLNSKHKDKTGT